MEWYPLKFKDIFLEKIWGGQALRQRLNKDLPESVNIGESWELSEHKSATSIVQNGEFKGEKLNDLVSRFPREILGQRVAQSIGYFPLLIKFIDANDRLSIQVHPDDEYAKTKENDLGKTESWYIVHAENGAKIICGLKRKLSRHDIEKGIQEVNLETYLNEFEVRTGDVIYVPAGTVHAIEAGTVIYEVQEVSDITYRLYDWGRMGSDGKPRPLHIDRSLEVIDYNDDWDHRTCPVSLPGKGFTRIILVGCRYFVIEKYNIKESADLSLNDCFAVVTILSGKGKMSYPSGETDIASGHTLLVPAVLGQCTIVNGSGDFSVLVTTVPESTTHVTKELMDKGVKSHAINKLGGLV